LPQYTCLDVSSQSEELESRSRCVYLKLELKLCRTVALQGYVWTPLQYHKMLKGTLGVELNLNILKPTNTYFEQILEKIFVFGNIKKLCMPT